MKKLVYAAFAAMLAIAGCTKDTGLEGRINDLEERISSLEEQIAEINEKTVPGIQKIVAGIQSGVTVKSVEPVDGGYTITFSDGTSATLKDGKKGDTGTAPAIGAKEVEGVFYWTAGGELMKDEAGRNIPVYEALPQLRINDGKWQVSYDEGASWTDVPAMGTTGGASESITVTDGPDSVIFKIGDKTYEIMKETSFSIAFENAASLSVALGGSTEVRYSISGLGESDQLEVGILSVSAGWEATVDTLATASKPGTITVTNVSTSNAGKVTVYASNGKGKTDIRSFTVEISDPYKNFIGTWTTTISDKTVTFAISEKEIGATYTVDLGSSFLMELTYNSDETFSLKSQTIREYTHSTYGPIIAKIKGTYSKDGKSYIYTNTTPLCKATLSADGKSFTLNHGTIKYTDGSTQDITGMKITGDIQEGDSAGKSLSYTNYPAMTFPVTFTKQ